VHDTVQIIYEEV